MRGERTVGPEALAGVDRLRPDVATGRGRATAHELLKIVLVISFIVVVLVIHAVVVAARHLQAGRIVLVLVLRSRLVGPERARGDIECFELLRLAVEGVD